MKATNSSKLKKSELTALMGCFVLTVGFCIWALTGCDETPPQPTGPRVEKITHQAGVQENATLTVTELGDFYDGRWNLVEFTYAGETHVFLQNYDRNNQAIVKVTTIKTP